MIKYLTSLPLLLITILAHGQVEKSSAAFCMQDNLGFDWTMNVVSIGSGDYSLVGICLSCPDAWTLNGIYYKPTGVVNMTFVDPVAGCDYNLVTDYIRVPGGATADGTWTDCSTNGIYSAFAFRGSCPSARQPGETTSVLLSPNPATDLLSVQMNGMEQIVIYDLQGAERFRTRAHADLITVDVSDWTSGVYLYALIKSEAEVERGRFLVGR